MTAYLALGKLVNETKYCCCPHGAEASPGGDLALIAVIKVAVRAYNNEVQLCHGGLE